jgi:predicted nucleic acid-binding protein
VSPAYLFDANAVVDLLDAAEYDPLLGEATLELMFYEATNVLWKIAAHRQDISRETGAGLADQLDGLRSEMQVYNLGDVPAARVYEVAWDTGQSAYDAAYVATADARDLPLVTSDGGIHDHAPERVRVVSPDDM